MMKERYSIIVNDVEKRILLNALSCLIKKQEQEHKSYGCVEDLVLKVCDAPLVKGRYRNYAEDKTR